MSACAAGVRVFAHAGQSSAALLTGQRLRRLMRRTAFPGSGSGRIAQLVEQLTLNQRVQGSSPCAPTNIIKYLSLRGMRRDPSRVTARVTSCYGVGSAAY